jgi:hypothetical protein
VERHFHLAGAPGVDEDPSAGARGAERQRPPDVPLQPFVSDYIRIRRADLEKLSAKSIDLERWKRKYPWLAKQLGLW